MNGSGDAPSNPFSTLELPNKTAKANANYIFVNLLSTFLLTHTHLDHIAGMVVNTAGFVPNHPLKKTIAAQENTIEALKQHVFNDVIWPNLSDEGEECANMFSYKRLKPSEKYDLIDRYEPIAEGLSVQTFTVTHGCCLNPAGRGNKGKRRRPVDSSAYFIRDDKTSREVLIWGDVEPDTISECPRNAPVWRCCAKKIADGRLNTVFLECSYDVGRKESLLYGHLSPEYLIQELLVLASLVATAKDLSDRPRNADSRKRKRASLSAGHVLNAAPPSRRLRNGTSPVAMSPESPPLSPPSTHLHDSEEGIHQTQPPHRTSLGGAGHPPFLPGLITPAPTFYVDEVSSPPSTISGRSLSTPTDSEQEGPASSSSSSSSDHPSVSAPAEKPLSSSRGAGLESAKDPLEGVTVVVTHVKETFEDGVDVVEAVVGSCRTLAERVGLRVRFVAARAGRDIYV